MSNKGVSTVIATILILMIAIALAGTAYIYFSGIVVGKTKNTISISDVSCNTSGYITVALSNDGTAALADADIQVLVDNNNRSDNYVFGTIDPHVIATVTATNAEVVSQEHTILIVSPSNTARQQVSC